MSTLFAFLFLFFLGALIVGLIKPSSMTKSYKGVTPTRKTIATHMGIATLFFFVLTGMTADASPKTDTKVATNTEQTPTPSATPESTVIPTPEPKKLYKVVEVVDGDTLKVDLDGKTETLRLIGLDTPETVDPNSPVQCFGKEASNKAKELLNGKSVELEADSTQGERDKYQRLLRYAKFEDGTLYNKLMISEGYAHEYTYNSNPYKYQSEFKEAEKQAREGNKGLWSSSTCSGDTTKAAVTVPAPTATPKAAATPKPTATPKPQATSTPKQTTSVDSIDYDCSDFPTHAAAQAYFDSQGGTASNNVDRLDGSDHDGIVCENNP